MTALAPAVSIAIRAFRRQMLPDAIASVLAQTHRDLELIVYDDAGDLGEIAAHFADPRVRYHRATTRCQASGRFSAAVSLCRGSCIGVLDDDDRYEPTFARRLLAALEADPEAGVAFCRTTYDASGTRVVPTDHRLAGRQRHAARAMLAERWTVTPSQMLIRRAALDAAWRDQPMPDGVAPDVWINLRIAMAGWHHVLVDDRLVVCGWHGAQISRAGIEASHRIVATWEQLRLDDHVLEPLRDRLLARAYIVRGMECLSAGERQSAVDDLRRAAALAPEAWPGVRRMLRVAASCGPTGSFVMRRWLDWSPRGRQRNRAPTRIGDGAARGR